MLVEMLNILEHFDLAGMGHNSTEYIRTVCEAMKAATADKDQFVGDPAFYDVPLERLTSKAHAADIAERIKAGERMNVERLVCRRNPRTPPMWPWWTGRAIA
jgi:gamma-glutamyltranspeptidase/glutathione hydrolase